MARIGGSRAFRMVSVPADRCTVINLLVSFSEFLRLFSLWFQCDLFSVMLSMISLKSSVLSGY